ncbi:peptidoglycan-binding domain-containing protein, partial [Acinetobacter baumannii]
LGFLKDTPNGKFGPATEEAIKKYCKENKLYVRKIIDPDLQRYMGFELFE